MAHTELTDLSLNLGQGAVPVTTKDFTGKTVQGSLHSATLTTPGGVSLNLTYRTDADHGTGELSCAEVFEGSPELEGIKNRLRIGVQSTETGTAYAQMRVAVIRRSGERAAVRSFTLSDLDSRCGGDVAEFLQSRGVLRVGTREELFAESNRNRGELAAEVPGSEAVEALLWVFAVTRVLPLVRQIEDGI
jgi:hypothetical protein